MNMELIAAETVAVLAPFLTEAGKEAAKEIGKDTVASGGKVLGWLRAHISGRQAEALADLEAKPESEDNQADMRKQLAKLLEARPELADELRALVPAAAGDTMTQTIGADSVGAQVKGNRNTVTQHKG